MKISLCFILIYFNYFKIVTSDNCFKGLCIPSQYDKTMKPKIDNPYEQNEDYAEYYYEYEYETNFTNRILVDFEKIQILDINEKDHTITLKLSLTMWWQEPRLTILPNATQEAINIYLPKEFTDELWLPDAYIENVHKINKFNFIHDFETFYHILSSNDSWIWYRNEVEIVIFCRMTFESYPMDEQICYFLIGSSTCIDSSGQFFELSKSLYKFNTTQQLALKGYRFQINQLPEYKKFSNDSYCYSKNQITGFELKFQHNFWKYLISYYIPSGILVIFSWVSAIIIPFS